MRFKTSKHVKSIFKGNPAAWKDLQKSIFLLSYVRTCLLPFHCLKSASKKAFSYVLVCCMKRASKKAFSYFLLYVRTCFLFTAWKVSQTKHFLTCLPAAWKELQKKHFVTFLRRYVLTCFVWKELQKSIFLRACLRAFHCMKTPQKSIFLLWKAELHALIETLFMLF